MPVAGRGAPGNLPVELTSFVGRRRALREGRRLLADARLLTLTGVGGTGKTRLALRAAGEVRRGFRDGVWFVDLSELPDPGLVGEVAGPETLGYLVMTVLGLHDRAGVPPVRRLTDHLADRNALLVLDNCEHLLPACAAVVDRLLRACPQLRIMATSREPLAVAGEVVFSVPPLATPRPGDRSVAGVRLSEAVLLFTARAQAVARDFDVTDGNVGAVAELCHRLDGLPLAIELAAASVRALTPQQILDRLADRFTVLDRGRRGIPARQQTLRACVDWSFDLCGGQEQTLWARLAVFAGGFDLDAVEGVCADEALPAGQLLDLVAELLDKSILIRDNVRASGNEPARYRMLETIRDYGARLLAEAGEGTELRRRHRDWCQRLLAQVSAEWISHRQVYWRARLNREFPNLRAAVEYCLAEPGEAEAALRLVVTVPRSYWFTRGQVGEARSWLDRALARTTGASRPRGRALIIGGHLAITEGEYDSGMRLVNEGEVLARRLDATAALADAAFVRGIALLYRSDLPAAVEALETARAVLATLPAAEATTELDLRLAQLIALTMATGLAGARDRADGYRREVLAITEASGERIYQFFALWTRAMSDWNLGRAEIAEAGLKASLRLKQTPGSTDSYAAARCLEALSWVAAGRLRHRRAATLLGAADARWVEIGTPVVAFGPMAGHHRDCERKTSAALGAAAFGRAFAEGRALSYDDAVSYALDDHQPPAPPAPASVSTSLTRREVQVAELIAEGSSNKEIAGRLLISTRTAENHVEHILSKLGFTSRTQVAAWKAAQRPQPDP